MSSYIEDMIKQTKQELKQLVRDKDQRMQNICREVGFPNIQSHKKRFKKTAMQSELPSFVALRGTRKLEQFG